MRGSTPACRRSCRRAWDHPRVRGDDAAAALRSVADFGGSPRMRGRRGGFKAACEYIRSIPAHAGSTYLDVRPNTIATEHPRVCGVDIQVSWLKAFADGASPRVRGRRHALWPVQPADRSIPAYAGSTRTSTRTATRSTGHPLVCGVDAPCHLQRMPDPGASPRMRGRQYLGLLDVLDLRGIPAYAGSTTSSCAPTPPAAGHPRVCGIDTS